MAESITYTRSHKWKQICLDGEMWREGATTWPGVTFQAGKEQSQGNNITWWLRKCLVSGPRKTAFGIIALLHSSWGTEINYIIRIINNMLDSCLYCSISKVLSAFQDTSMTPLKNQPISSFFDFYISSQYASVPEHVWQGPNGTAEMRLTAVEKGMTEGISKSHLNFFLVKICKEELLGYNKKALCCQILSGLNRD